MNVIATSPFKLEADGSYSFYAIDTESGNKISDALYIRGVISSLLKDEGEENIVGCGCSEAGCSGFWSEKFTKTDACVIWKIVQYRNKYELCFDRFVYERDAMKMLKDMVARKIGWNELAVPEYHTYEDFCDAVNEVEEALEQ